MNKYKKESFFVIHILHMEWIEISKHKKIHIFLFSKTTVVKTLKNDISDAMLYQSERRVV